MYPVVDIQYEWLQRPDTYTFFIDDSHSALDALEYADLAEIVWNASQTLKTDGC